VTPVSLLRFVASAIVAASAMPVLAQPRPAGGDAAVQEAAQTGGGIQGRVPETVPGRLQIEAAIQSRAWDRAERLLAAEIERAPASPELLKLLAQIFIIDRKPLHAAIAIKKAEALGPLDNGTRLSLALAYISLGQAAWALPELERLAASDPSQAIYPYWLARLDYDAGRYVSAIRRLEAVVARDPRFMRAYDNLGLCYEAQHQPENAIAHYREAIRLNREAAAPSPWPPLNLALLLRQRGERREAEGLFREAIRYDARFAPGHYELGTLLEEQGRSLEAVDALTRAATANPTYPEPHYALARIYRRLDEPRRADQAMATFQHLRDAREPNRP